MARWLLRFDGDLNTGEASVGITCLAGDPDAPGPAKDLARLVKAFVKSSVRVGADNPLTVISAYTGPYTVADEGPYGRAYATCTLGTVSAPLTT